MVLIGNEYIGFIGAVVGAIVGAVGSYWGTMKSLDKQIKYNNDLKEKQDEEDKRIVINIIKKFLKEEILCNKTIIEEKQIYNYLYKGYGIQYGHEMSRIIKFDSYESIKYDLMKYIDVKIVGDIVDLYDLFRILARYDDLNKLDRIEYDNLLLLKDKINNIISNLN
ncbi:hypothetical protein BH721_01405 [Clostridium baratii]|uniref:hypothetical protein n=1 Tax=Clostridium baratii TaxID=1561 RepID=UPI0009A45E70|nr:hypothetical protein [Clostridium baratii]OPF51536.1 hypothetical protein A1M12_03070 [Clostridium baratii]OPF55393.1 hypothetical protein BH721_01405 [Clostridium baratii]OPF57676.1 hypothetical protein BH724_08660 [Clostridium baratii]OPF60226.1 hypothetical protein BH725_06520 [Clostridium baratii]